MLGNHARPGASQLAITTAPLCGTADRLIDASQTFSMALHLVTTFTTSDNDSRIFIAHNSRMNLAKIDADCVIARGDLRLLAILSNDVPLVVTGRLIIDQTHFENAQCVL